MAAELTARTLSNSVLEGFKRVERFRKARADHIKKYVGKYMAETYGVTGEDPINLVFLAIRSLIPNVVQKGPNKVLTSILAQREYAEKLGMALDELQTKLHRNALLRACAVDACFGLTIAKSSIAASGQVFTVTPDIKIDPGQIYTERVSLDDFTCDPCCLSFDKATFVGHRIRIARNQLLAADGFSKELIRALPQAGTKADEGRAQELSQDSTQSGETLDLQDYVNIVELWVPEADKICYLPDPEEQAASDFLKVENAYCPPSGYYTFGALTQPVPDNPFPIAPVGVWRDLSDMASRLFYKAMKQADRQKNITLYRPSAADVAEAIRDAEDGEMLASEDPDGVKVASYEGPSAETVQMTQTIYGWFNLVAGNPDLMSGANISSDKATGQQILQQNASVSVSDMREMMYDFAAAISGKEAWYLHNDDLLFVPGQPGIPLIKRLADGREQQEYLTPQDKTGEFDTLGFEIVQRAPTVTDPAERARRVSAFTTQSVPQAFQSLMISMQAGVPFNIQEYLTRIAEDMGIIEVVSGIFNDPQFQARLAWYASTVGKQNKKEGRSGPGGNMDTSQNGQFPVGGTPMPGAMTQFNQNAQQTAAEGQSAMAMGGGL